MIPSQQLHSPLLAHMGVRDREMLDRLRFKVPVLMALALEPISRARADAKAAERARAARVGRDPRGVVDLLDFGHSVRLAPVCDHTGAVLREADVAIAEEAEEPGSRRRQRRARRADPLETLRKYGTISEQQFRAAEALRREIETALPRTCGGSASDVHVAPWQRAGISSRHIKACAAARAATDAVPAAHRLAVAWMVGGGTIAGLASYAHTSRQTAAGSLREGLTALVEHYGNEEAA
jgi:hypothetical protein